MKDSVSEKKWEVTIGQGALVHVHYETASTEVINEVSRVWRENFARSPTRLKRSLRRPGSKHNNSGARQRRAPLISGPRNTTLGIGAPQRMRPRGRAAAFSDACLTRDRIGHFQPVQLRREDLLS